MAEGDLRLLERSKDGETSDEDSGQNSGEEQSCQRCRVEVSGAAGGVELKLSGRAAKGGFHLSPLNMLHSP
jgi:hypothetical protein